MMRAREVAEMIVEGVSKFNILEFVMQKYGVSNATALEAYREACAYLQPENDSEYAMELAKKNQARLDKLYQDAMEEGDRKLALNILQEQNKLGNLYTQTLNVALQDFEIKLND